VRGFTAEESVTFLESFGGFLLKPLPEQYGFGFCKHTPVLFAKPVNVRPPDGKNFLVDAVPEANASSIMMVVNWRAALKGSRAGDGH